MQFANLGLAPDLVKAVTSDGYTIPTPIQGQAIPHVLAGKDVLGIAQTGTGKTAAFALPILHNLSAHPRAVPSNRPRCLVLCPTRELATQIGDSFRAYGRHTRQRVAVIFGGVGQNPQAHALRSGVDIVVATPGRLLDLVDQKLADLRSIEILVLDEADRMLDMGFIHDIRRLVAVIPGKRQTLLFSATMPQEIRTLSQTLLNHPVSIQVAPVAATADRIEQSVYFVEKREKPAMLAHLVSSLPMSRAIVFTRTKHGADRVVRQLHDFGIPSEAVHGNKSQNARERALKNFRSGKIPLLVATDIASRGIDVDGITHVVNFDITHEPETYIHRIGRTARAGAEGCAVSLCDKEERSNLRAIERLIRREIPVISEKPDLAKLSADHSSEESHDERDLDRDTRRSGRDNRGDRDSRGGSHGHQPHGPARHDRVSHPVGGGVGTRHPHSAPQDRTNAHPRLAAGHSSGGSGFNASRAKHAPPRHPARAAASPGPNDRMARPNTAPRPAGPRPHHPVKSGSHKQPMRPAQTGGKRR